MVETGSILDNVFSYILRLRKMHLISEVSNGKKEPYFIIDTLDAQIPMIMMLHTFEKHYGQPTRKLWYDGKEACARWILPQGCRGHKEDHILCVTVNKRGVSGSSKTALYIPVGRNFLLNDMGWLEDWQMPSLSAYRMWSKESSNRGTPNALLRDSTCIHLLISAWMQKKGLVEV